MDILASLLILLQQLPSLDGQPAPVWTYAEDVDGSRWEDRAGDGPWLQPLSQADAGPVITAPAGAVQDVASGQVLWAKNANQPRPLASVAKLMTALVVLEQQPDWDQPVSITPADRRPAGGRELLQPGQRYPLRQLWQGTLVASLNSATVAIVRAVGLDHDQYRQRASRIAQRLGMSSATFDGPTGLDPASQASAADALRLLAAAAEQEEIRAVAALPGISLLVNGEPRWIPATDELVFGPDMVEAGKTGYTEEAGYNLAVQVRRAGQPALRVVVLGSRSSEERFDEVRQLAEWAWGNYRW